MGAAHALVVDDEFLIDGPDFALPRQIAERGRRHGLDVLGQWDGCGPRVGCLGDGGAEEEVAEAGQVGFFACFAGGCC